MGALGETANPSMWFGGGHWMMDGFTESKGHFGVWFFQGAFCATCSTIVSGAVAERIQLRGFAIFTFIMTALIYPVVVYWGWSGFGILSNDEGSIVGPALVDFAGSGICPHVGWSRRARRSNRRGTPQGPLGERAGLQQSQHPFRGSGYLLPLVRLVWLQSR